MTAWTREGEKEAVRGLIAELLAQGEGRVAGSPAERRVQERLAERFAALGLAPRSHPFRHNRSLYEALVLHFAVGTAGSIAFPLGVAVSIDFIEEFLKRLVSERLGG